VTDARKSGTLKLDCTFATDRSHGIHPQHRVPQLYFDQLNTIAKHLEELQAERVLSQIRAMSAPNKAPSDTPQPTLASNTPQPTLAPSKETSTESPPTTTPSAPNVAPNLTESHHQSHLPANHKANKHLPHSLSQNFVKDPTGYSGRNPATRC